MVRFLAAAAGALVLTACGSSIALPVESPTPSANRADSPAADLRVHVDLLFGEHVYAIAKLSVAAAAGRKDDFHAYAGLLARNGGDLAALMRSALGETQGREFGQQWTQGNNLYVDYLVAAVTHDQAKADAAMTGLSGTYVPQLAQLINASRSLSLDVATRVATDQVGGIKLIVDDAVASSFPKLYVDLRGTYANATAGGDLLAAGIAAHFADRFPGDPKSKAVDFRTRLDTLLLQQAYLATMTSDGIVTGSQAGSSGASAALSANTAALSDAFGSVFGAAAGTQVGKVWDDEASRLVAYAKSGDAAARQNIIDAAAPPDATWKVFGADLKAGMTAIVQVVDDQRAKSFDKLALDDRTAALLLSGAGDAVSASAGL